MAVEIDPSLSCCGRSYAHFCQEEKNEEEKCARTLQQLGLSDVPNAAHNPH